MKREEFLTNAYNRIAVEITDEVLLYVKNVCQTVKVLPNGDEEVVKYGSIEEAYEKAVIDGVPLKEIVEETPEDEMFGSGSFDDLAIKFPRN